MNFRIFCSTRNRSPRKVCEIPDTASRMFVKLEIVCSLVDVTWLLRLVKSFVIVFESWVSCVFVSELNVEICVCTSEIKLFALLIIVVVLVLISEAIPLMRSWMSCPVHVEPRWPFRTSMLAFEGFQGQLAPHFAYGSLTKAEYARAHAMHFYNHLDEIQVEGV